MARTEVGMTCPYPPCKAKMVLVKTTDTALQYECRNCGAKKSIACATRTMGGAA